jgi:histidine ammonia-lyase
MSPSPSMSPNRASVIDSSFVTTEDIWRVACEHTGVVVSGAPEFQSRLLESRRTLEKSQAAGREVYGISTGFGDSVDSRIAPPARTELGQNLARYHRIGFGAPLVVCEARAAMVARLTTC